MSDSDVAAVMSSASSAITYTSVYTDSEPDKAFWGADDEEAGFREYEDNEIEDGSVDYPMDGGDDEDDDDGDSSRDDANDKDEEEDEEEEEEEHLAPPDLCCSLITVQPQAFISFPPEAEVERLLAMTTPSSSPPISL
ncbi:hypothetical protein Tco_0843820 [Tanacetum coccineum]